MPIKKVDVIIDVLSNAKDFFTKFFQDFFKLEPNMTLEKISEIISPQLDDVIKKYEERGFKYGAGKFSIKCVDKEHFRLEFEMYFQDDAGKWHKCANESDDRQKDILEEGAWKTIKALKVISFPIEKASDVDETSAEENLPNVKTKKHFADGEVPSVNELATFFHAAQNWQDFEARLREFLIKLPLALKKEAGTDEYAAKFFSCVEGETLRIFYKIYYKQGGNWVEKIMSCDLDESEAPTWATRGLSAKEIDVNDRYEKRFPLSN